MNYKILLAPTKNLQSSPAQYTEGYQPFFQDEAQLIINNLKRKSVEELSKLMRISNEIAEMNAERFKNWNKSSGKKTEFHAIHIYSGEAFKAFDFESLDKHHYKKLHESLFIISGLYGLLKPFDMIYPYRLEMGLNYSPQEDCRNLYQFWNERLTTYLSGNLKKDDVIVNLASQEYSSAIDFNKLGRRIITPYFKEYKNGELKMIMMFAKNARGKMARYIIENEIKRDDDLKKFNRDGYSFSENLSSESDWVFIR